MGLGSEVPASAIQWHMQKLRKKAIKMGVITPKRTPQARAKGPAPTKARKVSGKAKEMDDTDEDDADVDGASVFSRTSVDEDSDADGIAKLKPDLSLNRQKIIGGRITKLRKSPRKTTKVSYKALLDQFSAEENTSEEGEPVPEEKSPSDVGSDVTMAEGITIVKAEI